MEKPVGQQISYAQSEDIIIGISLKNAKNNRKTEGAI